MRAAQAPRHRPSRAFAPSPLSLHTVALSLAALSFLLLRRANQVQPRLHIIMAMSRVSVREAKTALNQAASMATVFRDASELALEREISFVIEKLREIGPLLDSLVALLGGRMNATVQQEEEEASSRAGSSQQNSGVMRQAWKKWEHIEGMTAFLNRLLRAAWAGR